jgi:ATP-dependent DNA helicase RecG
MESLEDILNKMELPVSFAVGDLYDHVSQIKNLEPVMTSLTRRLRDKISHDLPQPQQSELDRLSIELHDLFSGYENLPLAQKRLLVAKARNQLNDIKILLKRVQGIPRELGRSLAPDPEVNAYAILSRPVQSVRGVGTRIAALLEKKNLFTLEDLLFFLPRRYEDRRTVCRITETVPAIQQTVIGEITLSEMRFYGKRRIFEVTVSDGQGSIKAKWFKGREAFLRGTFKPGRRVILTGEITGFPFDKEIIHPDFEILDDNDDQLLHFKRIVPVYSETEGLHTKTLRRIIWQVVRDYAHLIPSPIPEPTRHNRNLIPSAEAIRHVHFPEADQDIKIYQEFRSDSHRSLVYEDFFFFQLGMALRKSKRSLEEGIAFKTEGRMLQRFYELLPFKLTSAQNRVIDEIKQDMGATRSMNRLLQGDVGSGKTVVAMAAMIIASENGFQSALMAPTEILAEQHYRNLKEWSEKIGLNIQLFTGSIKNSEKIDLQTGLMNGEINLVVGTHALIQRAVSFKKLGLVVIDEQHRFGVVQRVSLRQKGNLPDVLVMTATPIPRTLAMTVYGDLDVSVIDELPPGRNVVHTTVFSESQRKRVYEIIRREVKKGNQVFIVYPIIEESENLDLMDATRMSEHLQREIFPDCRVGLIHGRMKGPEKDQMMANFIKKQTHILVATTVIEVGIDIPSASLMIIEHAERFGLSQLHQLRGRVGRGDIPAYCILLAQKSKSDQALKRLRVMEETTDGFRISEEDLAIRGPGEFMGTRQSGLPDFRVANIVRDADLLNDAKTDAFAIVDEDPRLEKADHIQLKEVLFRRWGSHIELTKTG